jgi:hypothetical protein
MPPAFPYKGLRAGMFVAEISPGRLSTYGAAQGDGPRVIEIACEGQQGSRQDACCLRALHPARGQRRDIVRHARPSG